MYSDLLLFQQVTFNNHLILLTELKFKLKAEAVGAKTSAVKPEKELPGRMQRVCWCCLWLNAFRQELRASMTYQVLNMMISGWLGPLFWKAKNIKMQHWHLKPQHNIHYFVSGGVPKTIKNQNVHTILDSLLGTIPHTGNDVLQHKMCLILLLLTCGKMSLWMYAMTVPTSKKSFIQKKPNKFAAVTFSRTWTKMNVFHSIGAACCCT